MSLGGSFVKRVTTIRLAQAALDRGLAGTAGFAGLLCKQPSAILKLVKSLGATANGRP